MYSGYNIIAQWFGYSLLAWEVMVLKPSWTTIQVQKNWYDQELVSQLRRSSVYVNIHFLIKLIKIIYCVILFISHLLVRETSCACNFSLDIFSIILKVTMNKYSK